MSSTCIEGSQGGTPCHSGRAVSTQLDRETQERWTCACGLVPDWSLHDVLCRKWHGSSRGCLWREEEQGPRPGAPLPWQAGMQWRNKQSLSLSDQRGTQETQKLRAVPHQERRDSLNPVDRWGKGRARNEPPELTQVLGGLEQF